MPSEPCVHCLQPGQLSTMPPSGDEATQNISHESANIGAPPSGDSAQLKESLQLNNMGTSLSEDVCKLETVPGIVAFNPVSCNTLRTSIIKYKCNTCSKNSNELKITGVLVFKCDCDTEYITDIEEIYTVHTLLKTEITGEIIDFGMRQGCQHDVARHRYVSRRYCRCNSLNGNNGEATNSDDVNIKCTLPRKINSGVGCGKGCKMMFHYHMVIKERKENVTPAAKAFYEREKKRRGAKVEGEFYLCEYITRDCKKVQNQVHYHPMPKDRTKATSAIDQSLAEEVEKQQGLQDGLDEARDVEIELDILEGPLKQHDANSVVEEVKPCIVEPVLSNTTTIVDEQENSIVLQNPIKDDSDDETYGDIIEWRLSSNPSRTSVRSEMTEEEKEDLTYTNEEKTDDSMPLFARMRSPTIESNSSKASSKENSVSTTSINPANLSSTIKVKNGGGGGNAGFNLGPHDPTTRVVIFTNREKFKVRDTIFQKIGNRITKMFYTKKEYDGHFNNAIFEEVTDIVQVQNEIKGWFLRTFERDYSDPAYEFTPEVVRRQQTDAVSMLSRAYNGYFYGDVYTELTNFLLVQSACDIIGPANETTPYSYFTGMITNKMHTLDEATRNYYFNRNNIMTTMNTVMHVVNWKQAINCKTVMSLPKATNYGVPGLKTAPQNFP